ADAATAYSPAPQREPRVRAVRLLVHFGQVGEVDSPAGLARDRSRQVEPQGFGPEVDRLAPRFQGTCLRPRVVGAGEQTAAVLLGPLVDGTPSWRAGRGSRVILTTRARGAHPEVFLVYRPAVVSTGDLEPVSKALEPRGGLLVREVAVGLGGFPATE